MCMDLNNCKRCPLYKFRTNVVIGEGAKNSIMLVGEAPGKNEDIVGRPFVGRAGKILDELLANVGLKRKDIFITNLVKCRPPNNRDPLEEEIKACSYWLDKQIIDINPRVIISLGRFSMRYFQTKFNLPTLPISKVHGIIYNINTLFFKGKFTAFYHPAVALYKPAMKIILKEDWENLMGYL